MAFVQTFGGTEQVIIAGSFHDDVATVRGTGFSVAVSSGVYTITFDRKYDGLISCTATVMNPDMASGEAFVPVITAHSVSDGTAGGTVTLKLIDDAGNIETSPAANTEVHFCAVLTVDT